MRTLLALLLVLVACGPAGPPPPGPLDRATFKRLLLGSELIEARLQHENVIAKRSDSPVEQYYDDLFKEEGVTKEDFRRTFDAYTQHPAELKVIYQEVLAELDSLKDLPVH